MANSTFSGNLASQNGAAVFQEDTPGSLTFCLLSNNRAQVPQCSNHWANTYSPRSVCNGA